MNQDALLERVKALCALNGTSGDEGAVADYIARELEGVCQVSRTPLGNVIAYKKGTNPDGQKRMLAAHMDEVGYIVTEVLEDGFLRFSTVGGVDVRVTVSKRVTVGEQNIPGVIGVKAIHMTKGDERGQAPEMDSLCIDIGAKSKEEAEKLAAPGDRVHFLSDWVEFGDGRVKAKALDDRAGCALLMELAKNETFAQDAYFVFTVCEEIGGSGAVTATNALDPDFGIVVDVTTASDMPAVSKNVCAQGKGPVLSFKDGGTLYPRDLFLLAKKTAEEKSIPYQIKTYPSGGTDAGSIHRAVDGVKVVGVSLPGRYIHAGASVLKKSDLFASYNLLAALVDTVGC